MIIGRNEREAILVCERAADFLAVFRVTIVKDNIAAVPLGRSNLADRRVIGHDDAGGHAEQACSERDGLRMVSRREGDNTRAALTRVELRKSIECTTKLEGAHALQVFALEEYFRGEESAYRTGSHYGSAVSVMPNAFGRGDDVIEGGEVQHGAALAYQKAVAANGIAGLSPARPV